MGTAIFMVLLACGYWYTTRDLSSRFKLKRTYGWEVYFLVALYGCIFVLQGIIVVFIIWLVLLIFSQLASLIATLNHYPLDLHYHADFLNWSFLEIKTPVVVMLATAILLCLLHTSRSPNIRLKTTERKDLYKKLTKTNGLEGILYQSMEQGNMVLVTLASQRIYIGLVYTALNESTASDNLVLLPLLSGKRDPNALQIKVENNYAAYYQRNKIDLSSKPDSVFCFRKIIFLHQIESLSLFDPLMLGETVAPSKVLDTPR